MAGAVFVSLLNVLPCQAAMHAVIKIISFLIFGAAVALGGDAELLAATLLLIPLYVTGQGHIAPAFRLLSRLRWLFLSILLVYVFFTPGQLLFPVLDWGPTWEGLLQGAGRIAALVLLVLAVNWLLESTAQDAFLSATLWCLRPLARLGFPQQRLAVRICLTLEAVRNTRTALLVEPVAGEPGDSRIKLIVRRASHMIDWVITQAEAAPLRKITVLQESSPPLVQWLIPILLGIFFILLRV